MEVIASDKVSNKNPCVGCGACCAFFRVSFHWLECESAGGTVPDDDIEQLNHHMVAMKGTNKSNPRCVNLSGVIGKDSQCSKYETRSTSCRGFDASYENGVHEERCDKARIKHGLKPLTANDWL